MFWKEIKIWAKNHGYGTIKDKQDGKYYWSKLDSSDIADSGVASSVSKLAIAIYNHMTNNRWVEHQKQYQENLQLKKAELTDY